MTQIPPDDLIDRMSELKSAGVPFVVATVIGTRGSTPRKAGAKMVVAGDGRTFGTVGGGIVESRVIEKAREMLAAPEVTRLSWELASPEAGGAICGGAMEFLLEPFMVKPKAFVFGGGHVGHALARILNWLSFDVTVIDYRDDILTPERFPGATRVLAMPAEAASTLAIPETAFCAVTNPTHEHDLATMKALARRPLKYLGLMASRKKRREVLEALEKDGVAPEACARVHSPIGLAIGAETPEEIAVSIAGQMIEVLRKDSSP